MGKSIHSLNVDYWHHRPNAAFFQRFSKSLIKACSVVPNVTVLSH